LAPAVSATKMKSRIVTPFGEVRSENWSMTEKPEAERLVSSNSKKRAAAHCGTRWQAFGGRGLRVIEAVSVAKDPKVLDGPRGGGVCGRSFVLAQ